MTFGDRLAAQVAERRSQLVLGLDPDPGRLWPGSAEAAEAGAPAGQRADPAEWAAAAVSAHCEALIEAAGPACAAVKLQLACFERLGAPGWRALARVLKASRSAGLLAIADGKRGDVPVTAGAYAQALVGSTPAPSGEVAGLGVDAFTANPLLGRDALEPLIDAARAAGAAVFVLVRTANPGAADVQDLELAGGSPLWERLAALVEELGAGAGAGESGLSDVGAVTGATVPRHLSRMRELMPRAVFLLPGVGAQGGRVADLAPAFGPGPAGGLVTASRSIAQAHERTGGEPAAAAAAAAEELRAAAWGLSHAGA